MIMEGSGILLSQKQDQVDVIEFGDFFGEDAVITTSSGMFTFRVTEDVHAISIPVERVQDIPIVQWKLVEQFEKRLKIVRTHFQVRWYDSYALGLDELDRQHKSLFDMLEELYTIKERYGFGDEFEEKLASYIETLESHLMYEESLMTKWEYHRYPIQKNAHTSIMKTIEQYMHSDKHDTQSHARFLDQIKEWLLSHTLIEDRKYAKFFRDRDVR
jgi:hemerythrin